MTAASVGKSNLELVNDCDKSPREPARLWWFMLERCTQPVGRLDSYVKSQIPVGSAHWRIDPDRRTVTLLGTSRDERDARMDVFLRSMRNSGILPELSAWTGEENAVYGPGRSVLLSLERAAAPLFGITTYGVQLLAYTNTIDGLKVWLQKRARHKQTYAGLLDSTVGGRIRSDESPLQALVREADEEATIPPDMVQEAAIAVGAVSYLDITQERVPGQGVRLNPDTRLIYELELPTELQPVPKDGEVEEFVLLDMKEMNEAMRMGRCTPGKALIMLDFFIRRGILNYENEPDYLEIVSRLHRNHEHGYA
ncbi:uncharacterized protein JN550_004345 [Neoarthrinium moseri]|uniref:uncharacterized protein n=1 Tax=Neoarthrinium moseri TaxID=1658444 RepID=UPI001FDCC930|nr:uncharacterized protein JN550_004345 [Neoarthrinium moseri]KAI1872142.1 hypothetical protein JN550_004345 [Neoarthrinium moseri]